jgi:hypothetical protein
MNDTMRIIAAVVIAVACAIGVLYCVTRVADLHTQAAVLQSCLQHLQAGCPNTIGAGSRASTLLGEAETIGMLGWLAFILGVVVTLGGIVDAIT